MIPWLFLGLALADPDQGADGSDSAEATDQHTPIEGEGAEGPMETSAKPPSKAEPASKPEARAKPEYWAGRQAIFGVRKLPFIGKIQFRTDNYVLARVVSQDENGIHLNQQVCKVTFEKTAGATVQINEKGPASMPHANVYFERWKGMWHAPLFESGWNTSDHDGDGRPGIAVNVKAPLCGGTLHMASEAKTESWAQDWAGGGLAGEAEIHVKQIIEEVDGACLRLVTKGHDQWMRAQFIYAPVDADTCDDVPESAWDDPSTAAPTIPGRPVRTEIEE